MTRPNRQRRIRPWRLLPLFILIALAACERTPATKAAQVDLVFIEAATRQVNVQGRYRSGCEQIADIAEAVSGTTATIELLVSEDPALDCAGSDIPFTTTLPTALDLTRQGRYTVIVNGVSAVAAVNAAGDVVTSTGTLSRGVAAVESAELVALTTVPVQVRLDIRGTLPDECTAVRQVDQTRRSAVFTITVETERDETASCPDAPLPYTESVALNVSGLPAGTYTVQIQGITRSFTLAADNVDAAALARCTFASPDLAGFANAADGYCLQFPDGYIPATPRPGLLLLEDREPGDTRVLLTIEQRGDAGGRTASQLADRAVLDLPVPAVDVVRTTMTIGGVEAVVLDRIPGAVESRQAFLVAGGNAYVLTLLPVGDAYPAAVDSAATLWAAVTQTVAFLEE